MWVIMAPTSGVIGAVSVYGTLISYLVYCSGSGIVIVLHTLTSNNNYKINEQHIAINSIVFFL